MSINVQLLKEICEVAGAPGYEDRVRNLVTKELDGLVDDLYTDTMGNLIALKKGKSDDKRAMAAAHMDEIGFMVKHIDDKGFIRFHTLGGFDPKTLTAQRVIVHGKKDVVGVMGCKPIHLMSPEERGKGLSTTDFFIDTGLPKSQVKKLIEIGNPITRERDLIEMGNCVNVKSLDNRVSVFILIEALRALKRKKIPYDFYGAFTVQEEVGIRGAMVAGHHIEPDFSFGLDITIAFDVPGAKPEECITHLGKGTAIKMMDSSVICDPRMVKYMKKTADKHKIKWQPEVLTGGGTDTAGMQRMSPNGTIAGAISIPCRNVHQVIEMCDKSDIKGSIQLLTHCIAELDKNKWDFN